MYFDPIPYDELKVLTNVGDDGTSSVHKGDVFVQRIYTASVIVDRPGDTA